MRGIVEYLNTHHQRVCVEKASMSKLLWCIVFATLGVFPKSLRAAAGEAAAGTAAATVVRNAAGVVESCQRGPPGNTAHTHTHNSALEVCPVGWNGGWPNSRNVYKP